MQQAKPCSVHWIVAAMLAGALLLSAGAQAAVTADPERIRFDSQEDTATVQLRANGDPLPASAIRNTRLLASGHNYMHMLDCQAKDGKVLLKPTRELEAGSYDLVLDTRAGHVTIKIYAPLDKMRSVVDEAATATGISMEQARDKLGLTTTLPRVEVDIDLPPVYYEGQAVRLRMPQDANRTYEWGINGVVLKDGRGANTFTYVFPEPGSYVLSYVEKVDGKVAAAELAETTVVPVPAVAWEARAGQEFVLMGPAGYTAYVWTVDGKEVAKSREFAYTFAQPGHYTVECMATGPTEGPGDSYMRRVYETTVPSK